MRPRQRGAECEFNLGFFCVMKNLFEALFCSKLNWAQWMDHYSHLSLSLLVMIIWVSWRSNEMMKHLFHQLKRCRTVWRTNAVGRPSWLWKSPLFFHFHTLFHFTNKSRHDVAKKTRSRPPYVNRSWKSAGDWLLGMTWVLTFWLSGKFWEAFCLLTHWLHLSIHNRALNSGTSVGCTW